MKIIDMRVRAPFKAYEGSNIYQTHDANGYGGSRGYKLPNSVLNFSMEELVEEAHACGVEKMVVPVRKSVDGNNDDLVELIRQYPNDAIGMAGIGVNSLRIQDSIDEIQKYVIDGPCTGIIMEPGQDKTPWMVNSHKVFPLYEFCQNHNVPIFMTYGGIMVPNIRYYAPEPISDVLETFPKLKLGLAHGGWPYVTEMAMLCINHNNLWLAPDFYMIDSPGQDDYYRGANNLLKDRIMFASAYPLMPLKEASEYYMARLNENVVENVMYRNAKEFLGI